MKLYSILIVLIALFAIAATSPSSAQPAGPSAAPVTSVDVHALPPLSSQTPFDAQKATTVCPGVRPDLISMLEPSRRPAFTKT